MKIKLTKFTLAHAEEPLVKIGDEPLTLEFVTDYDISDAQIVLKNGDSLYTGKLARKMTLPPEISKAGRILGTITLFDGATVLKEWQLMPIKVIERPQGIESFNEIFANMSSLEMRMCRRINEVENASNEQIKALKARIAELEEKTNLIL